MPEGRYVDFMASVRRRGGYLELDLRRSLSLSTLETNLSDQFMKNLRSAAHKENPEDDCCYFDLDISENNLPPEACRLLVRFLTQLSSGQWPVCVRSLRAYRNCFGDEGALHLAELIWRQRWPLAQLHLSHNSISGYGAACIILALACAKAGRGPNAEGTYPLRVASKVPRYTGCWMRLEQNEVQSPEKLAQELRAFGARIEQVGRSERDWGPLRAPHWANTSQKAPQVVLYLFNLQRKDGEEAEKPRANVQRAWDWVQDLGSSELASSDPGTSEVEEQIASDGMERPAISSGKGKGKSRLVWRAKVTEKETDASSSEPKAKEAKAPEAAEPKPEAKPEPKPETQQKPEGEPEAAEKKKKGKNKMQTADMNVTNVVVQDGFTYQ
ncbi:unnamed protein product [Effrenium voratum]|nr:unnamed protein product [Effrenium voratum]